MPTDAEEKPTDAAMTVSVVETVADVAAPEWDACANPLADTVESISQAAAAGESISEGPESISQEAESPCEEESFNPFISHAFLKALEESGSVGGRSGWYPRHLVLEAAGRIAAVMPCYAKSHSQGEYVFDHGWADAYERAGGRYYPKLQISVPFTPVTGRRLLVRAGVETAAARSGLVLAATQFAERMGASSVHFTFVTRPEWDWLGARGMLLRTDRQFHFLNRGYRDYADFLDTLASRKRKALRKERREALAGDVSVRWLSGGDLTEDVWDAFFAFYMDTGGRKWGRPYLTRAFFSRIGEAMADRILLVMAYRGGRPIAGALNFVGNDAIYGRHWGCVEHHPFLHFELCYHQAIDFAIDRGLKRVEAGAQGEHKLARGYEPVTTRSAHWIADPALRRAVADYLVHERRAVARETEMLGDFTPFRRGETPEP